MKKFYSHLLFMMLLMANCHVFAQDYMPFQQNQCAIYRIEANQDSIHVYQSFSCDTVIQRNGYKLQLFNMAPNMALSCYINCLHAYKDLNGGLGYQVDSVTDYRDSVVVHRGLKAISIKKHMQVGDKWSREKVNMTCVKKGEMSIFGKTDSFVTISISTTSSTEIVKLSKHYGLLSLAPRVPLVGLESGDEKIGIRKPQMTDFFKLSVGDKLYWRHESGIGPDYSLYYTHDSITGIRTTDSQVTYVVQRRIYDDNKLTVKKLDSVIIDLKEFSKMFQINYPSFYKIEGSEYVKNIASFSYNRVDKSYALDVDVEGLVIEEPDCKINMVMDVGTTLRFNSNYTIPEFYSHSWGSASDVIIGAIVDGKKLGEPWIPNSIAPAQTLHFELYPNPGKGQFQLQTNSLTPVNVHLYNSAGQLVYQGLLKSGSQSLDVSFLPSGIYNLVANSQTHSYQTKVIIQ